jgi:DNA-binding SARP family transcriptional activator
MNMLQVNLFGSIRVCHNYGTSEVILTPLAQKLLAYLLLERLHIRPREIVEGVFWGDYSQERARNCLNTTLWRLRSALEPEGVRPGTYLVSNRQGEVGFNTQSDFSLDVADFEEETTHWLSRPVHSVQRDDISAIENSLKLYRGDLLEGFYEDWVLRERERLCSQYLNSLTFLMQCCQLNGDLDKSIAYGRRILDLDPLREEIHRKLMRLYLENGQRTMAVQQYKNCFQVLAEELGILPMEETQALYTQILLEGSSPVTNPPPSQSLDLDQPWQQLYQVNLMLENAQTELRQAKKMVENFLKQANRISNR